MFNDFLSKHITSQAANKNGGYVQYGYGQVEPNHLSAQRTAQVYAQLPAAANIEILEQGQFVKYDYASGVASFGETTEQNQGVTGEWMLVYNEIKLYREHQMDCEFAMLKDNYQARIYSPFGYGLDKNNQPTSDGDTAWDRQSRYYDGKDSAGHTSVTVPKEAIEGQVQKTYTYDDVTAAPDMYEMHYNVDPFHIEGPYKEARMPAGTTMVPRVLKTNVGDIFTTNMIMETTLELGDILAPNANGILAKDNTQSMKWQVVKKYTMPDHQPGVKIMRIA